MTDKTRSHLGFQWFEDQGWQVQAYQAEAWQAFTDGKSGLINLPTGSGKTYAALFGPLQRLIERRNDKELLIYITPLKALTRDITLAIQKPIDDLALPITVENRTGDTSSYRKKIQRSRLPEILVTTPESLALLLSYQDTCQLLKNVCSVIIDEWHDLIQSKRGQLLELCLAQLREWQPKLQTWALSATLADCHQAAQKAVGWQKDYQVINPKIIRPLEVKVLIPEDINQVPWTGYSPIPMLNCLIADLNWQETSLLFTNTRSQAERCYQALIERFPNRFAEIGLHHSSINPRDRRDLEGKLKHGLLKLVVATSSLDLGVDFGKVTQIYQIGSPKSISRLLQRAGRSGHAPGQIARIKVIPSHVFEIIEIEAIKHALQLNRLEATEAKENSLDVLIQHMTTLGIGPGFRKDNLYDQVRQCTSFRKLSEAQFSWCLDLLTRGGKTLNAYPDYHRLTEEDGIYRCKKIKIAQLHRLNVGTILSDANLTVKLRGGKNLGQVEERFFGHMKEGDTFCFSGRILEFVKIQDTTAIVKIAKSKSSMTPRWYGSQMAISPSLADSLREILTNDLINQKTDRHQLAMARLLNFQNQLSHIPNRDERLVELIGTRDGFHSFIYPFEGRFMNQAIGLILSLRLSRLFQTTIAVTANEYGVELLCPIELGAKIWTDDQLWSSDGLLDDLLESVNLADLGRLHFREIARISGLVFPSSPGKHKTARQLQASAGLIFDVFRRFDPENLLLEQTNREVLAMYFDGSRLSSVWNRLQTSKTKLIRPKKLTPFAFPLWYERSSARLSQENLNRRIDRIYQQWKKDGLRD